MKPKTTLHLVFIFRVNHKILNGTCQKRSLTQRQSMTKILLLCQIIKKTRFNGFRYNTHCAHHKDFNRTVQQPEIIIK